MDEWQRETQRPRVLVIDDEPTMLKFFELALLKMEFDVHTVGDGPKGIALYSKQRFDLVIVDLRMPKMDGIEVIRQLKRVNSDVIVIVATAFGSIDSAVEAIKAGATDFLTKPVDPAHLEVVLRKSLRNWQQIKELRLLRTQVAEQGSFEGLVGVSHKMRRVYELIRRVADSAATILIQGETGTGKELVARAIHNLSSRKEDGFMPISCGALPETILDSELFGYEKGAFTGAINQKYGLVEQAENGTLFLDEIEEMSPALQVKLLRTIQEREVLRVGGDKPIKVDFRLIATTNVNLQERVKQGVFRSDLFYRMSGIAIDLPPLRVRQGDIPLLANHFIATYSAKYERPVKEFTPEAMMLLKAYSWPGNVRELENVIEQAVLLSSGETISLEDLPDHLPEFPSEISYEKLFDLPLREARAGFERQYLKEMLSRADGNVKKAAHQAGIVRQHFHVKMKRFNISK